MNIGLLSYGAWALDRVLLGLNRIPSASFKIYREVLLSFDVLLAVADFVCLLNCALSVDSDNAVVLAFPPKFCFALLIQFR